jgi:Flp pilus assembly protein TadD
MPLRLPIRLVLVALSLAFALLHAGPLYGTGAALVITILSQLYLPGWLLARAFGKDRVAHPLSRFTWALAAGLGLVICLGGVMRLLQLPVSTNILALHGIMAALAVMKPAPAVEAEQQAWRFERRNLPLYLLVVICCATLLYVSIVRGQIRFNSFPDQTMFASYADWLAHHPESPHVVTRMAGTIVSGGGDVRFRTDGWTYNHAAWVWTSGVPAAQLIWYDLTPLFVWTIPLVIFALAYQLTRRETAAAWSAAALTLAGLMTLDALVYRQNNLAFGQFGLLELNTLRMFSRALMLPLAWFAGLSYLNAPRLRDLLLVFLAGLALAILHPQQIMIFLVSMAATTALWWLAQPTRTRFRQALALAAALAATLILPYVQRASTITAIRYTERVSVSVETVEEDPLYRTPNYVLPLPDLPVIGATYVIQPSVIFYHPLVSGATLLGLIAGVWWRRRLAAQYIFGSTAITLLLLFTPAVTAAFARLTTLQALPGMIFGIPIALIWGLALDAVLCGAGKWLASRRNDRTETSLGRSSTASTIAPVHNSVVIILIASILLLLLEPIPIPASARDQIRASNELQTLRTMHASDQQLLDSLLTHLPADQTSILITPNPVAGYIIESVPGAVVTGGRRGHGNKWAFEGTQRFFGQRAWLYDDIRAPWPDTFDLEFIAEYGVTHIVVEADDTRLPQLLFQPERFALVDTPAGYWVFRVLSPIEPDRTDALYGEMNATYGGEGDQRWDSGVFILNRPANPVPWRTLAATWAENLEQNPDDARARYGLALTDTLMGRDGEALGLWQQLHEAYPQAPTFVEAAAYTLQALGRDDEAVQVLVAAMDNPEPTVQVLAAKALLTPAFFTRLGQEEREQIIGVTQASADTWAQLAVRPALDEQRQRANLFMSAGMLETAADWLDQIPAAEISPQDLTAQASIALAQGDVERALAVLHPAVDPDEMAAARFLHPDRWENNTAAEMYRVLAGEIPLEAEQECPLNGDVFVSPLAMADSRALYVMDVHTEKDEPANALTVCATYGNPRPWSGYDVRTWRIQVVSPDAETHYGVAEVSPVFTDAALTRAAITITLPEDVPPLTPAQVYIEAMYDLSLVLGRVVRDVVLNRPDAAVLPVNAVSADLRFGDTITLHGYTASHDEDGVEVTLYWEASAPPAEDYQVFVHVVDAGGQPLVQGDSGPLDGRYPTSQWRTDTLIEDRHIIPLGDLAAGEYRVLVGLYRLSDSTRLSITPADERVANDSVLVYTFSR